MSGKTLYIKYFFSVCTLVFLCAGQAYAAHLEFKKGERLTLVLVEDREHGEELRKHYLSKTFSMAESYGFKPLQDFKVTKNLLGEDKMRAAGLYSWPSVEQSNAMRNYKNYTEYLKPLRPLVWQEMVVIDFDIKKSMAVDIYPERSYTIAKVWFNDKKKYKQYYKETQALRDELGSKIVLKFSVDEYSTLRKDNKSPDMVVMLEWPDEHGPEKYLEASRFQENLDLANQGIEKIDWYQLGFWN